MNYGSIRSHFKALLNRSDITDALADTFLDQGIARIQRSLRIPAMEKMYNFNVTASTPHILVPNDFLEVISIYYDNNQLVRLPMSEMLEHKKAAVSGAPYYFTREGGRFLLAPEPTSGTVTVTYYGQFAEMTTDSSENILAKVASDLIIYAALTYAADYFLDERSALYEQKYVQFMTEIQEQANDAETTGTLQKIRPSYNL
tara:strand:- start:174 stop:776 length:603 start_codon:yes stop_codon:yes gene_type:complete